MDKVKVAILGGSGYTAVELMKILLRHPHAEIVAVTSRQDEHVADLHPSLLGRLDLRCEPFDADRLKAKGVQVAFGCLPHGASMETHPAAARARHPRRRPERRLPPARPERLRAVVQETPPRPGEPRPGGLRPAGGVRRRDHDGAKLVANPGCYPQTAILGLAPLVANGLIELTGIIDRQQERRVRGRADAEADDPLPRVQRERVGLRRRHAPPHAGDRAGAVRRRRRSRCR